MVDSNLCPTCEVEEESSLHFLGRCDGFVVARLDVLEGQLLTLEELRGATPTSLLKYIRSTGRLRPGPYGEQTGQQRSQGSGPVPQQ